MVSVTPRPRFTPGKGPVIPSGQETRLASELVWTQEARGFLVQLSHRWRRLVIKVVQWLRRLAASLSRRRPVFAHALVHVGFVVDRVALGQVFLRVLRFPLSASFHRGSAYSYITWRMNNRPLVAEFQLHSLTPSTWTTTDFWSVGYLL
jgi:hypothetical protein